MFAQDRRYHLEAEASSNSDDEVAGTNDKKEWTSDVIGEGMPKADANDGIFNGTSAGSRKWTKRVQKEWKILKNDLPAGTIYVRAFEDRMDLLPAAMVAACGTPYHDGLFFFDLHLPPSYPDSPLQGLVLTAQPYYNEAGYTIQAGTPVGHRNELPYSENAYLLTLQTMLHLLRRPPSDLMGDHFRHPYLEGGCLVGTLDVEANATEASLDRPCSAAFRLALANIVPRIAEALIDIGAQGCEQFNRLRVSASH
ncbi:hypothetical protein PR202_gb28606 [Eleusine coracana subsp. coracana]|uniref:UBC core domain-containing protein n=1 Tax=Eleusine coracana subsp. coracana TaxID=191504 RepID=A0AAV5FXB8_ELECO|nr:hypothetical protein PR202_gb28606 [Eleusine coracana subsp. coracana]